MTPAKLLKRAAAYVAEHGIVKGVLGTNGGPCCMLGALSLASGERGEPTDLATPSLAECQALVALNEELALAPLNREGIAAWNDADRRTKEDVIEAFEAAAKRLP